MRLLQIENTKKTILREEYVAITGNATAAMILDKFVFWMNNYREIDRYILEENQRQRLIEGAEWQPTEGWITKTLAEISDETMLGMSPASIGRYLKQLVDSGFIQERENPVNKYNRTRQYRVNLLEITEALTRKGYLPLGFKCVKSTVTDADSTIQNVSSIFQNEKSTFFKMKNDIDNSILKENIKEEKRNIYKESYNPPLCPPKGEVTLTGDEECRFEDDADNSSSWENPDFLKDLFSETADENATDEDDGEEQINPKTQTVFDTWNEKKILVHKSLTPELRKTIEKAVKAYGYDRVLVAIGRYSDMLKDEEYTMMTYRWSLRDFLKRANALPEFMDDGSKWANYCEYLKNPKPPTSNYKAQMNNDVEDDDKDAYSDWEKNLPF